MVNYKDELQRATNLLADNGYIFIGQNMVAGGTSMYHMVKHLPLNQRIELPVFEDIQAGIATGMALEGLKVCSVYPRMDFLICAINQIVNHLDKAEVMSDGQFKPKVIIRTCVGSVKPMMPGPQHCQNYYNELKSMCKNINVVLLDKAEMVYEEYEKAMNSDKSTILIELSDLYNVNLIYDIEKSKDILPDRKTEDESQKSKQQKPNSSDVGIRKEVIS
jgi:pyruvate/2-oxoglutarate/acetoin dehydrogenase E1 component